MDLINKWASLEEIADYLGVTKDTIRNWIKKQIYRHIRLEDCGNSNFQKLMNGLRVEKVLYNLEVL